MSSKNWIYAAAVAAAGFALWRLYQAVTPSARGGAMAAPPAVPVLPSDTRLAIEDWDDITARKAEEAVRSNQGIWGNLP